jgi:hypothetical protein
MADQYNSFANLMRGVLAKSIVSYRGKVPFMKWVNRDYKDTAKEKGSTIDVPISKAQTVQDATYTSQPRELTTTETEMVQITLDQHKETRFHLTDLEDAQLDEGKVLPDAFEEGIIAHAKNINTYLHKMYKDVYQFTGTAGTTPFATDAKILSAARKILNRNDIPDFPRAHIMDVDADENAVNLGGFQNVNESGTTRTQERGEVGLKMGFMNMWDNQVQEHTRGAAGSSLVNGGSQTGKTLVVDGFSAEPVAGDIFTIAGNTQQYTVVSATALSGTESTLTIEPALAASPADNAAVTFVDDHVANLAFHRDAFTFAQRPLKDKSRAPANIQTLMDRETGLSMRLQIQRPNNVDVWVLDVLFGGKLTRPLGAVRVLG